MIESTIVNNFKDWIKHPQEFGKEPEKIRILSKTKLFWPNNKIEECFLIEFYIDEKMYIGFTGPISWVFLNIDFDNLQKEDLFILYTGWFISFSAKQLSQKDINKKADLLNSLRKNGYTDISLIQHVEIADEIFIECKAKNVGHEVILVLSSKDYREYPLSHKLPFYEYIGQTWRPFDF